MHSRFYLAIVVVCLMPAFAKAEADGATYFEQHVRPLLASKCVKCHGSEKQEGGLRLDSLSAMLEGGDSGPALVRGEPSQSLLVEAVKFESLEMPPTGKLTDAEINRLQEWVALGAIWPEHSHAVRAVSAQISDDDRQWWAFQPLHRPEVPNIDGDHWSRNEIDRFVAHRLAEQGMSPAPAASKEQLIRRVYYDLIGVPPTPVEIDAFVENQAATAWEELIDSLLSDSRYGEHWGRYWLDLVRYAESDGWNKDEYRPQIFHYRDYVVRAFNEDKSYPQFVLEQLAGDEIPNRTPENMVATGYLRLGIYEYNQRDARSLWNDTMNEITDVTADVFIGMGMACARCHDHKFDPILQRDYFKLRAFFEPLIWRDDVSLADATELAQYEAKLASWKKASREIQQQIDALLKPYFDRKWKSTADKFPLDIQACFYKPVEQRTSWEHQMSYLIGRQFEEEGGGPLSELSKDDKAKHEELLKQLAEFDHLKPEPPPPLMTATDFLGEISPTQIPDSPDDESIPPGFLTVLCDRDESSDEANDKDDAPVECSNALAFASASQTTQITSSGRRTALARWIGKPDNPLTMRVIVNRVWQQHFGQGIVPSASDFGRLGLPPTHPELLDWLTLSFVEQGWSFKQLHKQILMSATWQQSSLHPLAGRYQELDPNEDLLWRFRVRRLSAEQIRDAALSASGELTQGVGGPSVDGQEPRRSLYVKFRRNNPDTFLQLFDIANGLVSMSERNRTTTPVQSLMMLNGDWTLRRAEKMADRLMERESGGGLPSDEPQAVLSQAFRLTWGREPSPEEMSRSLRFVGEPIKHESLIDFCHAMLNSSEFLYVD